MMLRYLRDVAELNSRSRTKFISVRMSRNVAGVRLITRSFSESTYHWTWYVAESRSSHKGPKIDPLGLL
jgi:hypothetical protein